MNEDPLAAVLTQEALDALDDRIAARVDVLLDYALGQLLQILDRLPENGKES